jgi:hypothetical protein
VVRREFNSGDVITAAYTNANNDDLANGQTDLTAADIADDAGIESTQLADRYAVWSETVYLTGSYYRENTANTVAVYHLPQTTTGTEVWRKVMTLKPGRAYYIVAATVHCKDLSASVGEYPHIWVQHNGNTLGGGVARVEAADTNYYLQNTNPIDNPLKTLSNNDYISIMLGKQAATGTTTWNGATVTLTFKMELNP